MLPLHPGGPVLEKMEVHVEQGQLQCHSRACLHYSFRGIYALVHGNSCFALNLRACRALGTRKCCWPWTFRQLGKGRSPTPELLRNHLQSPAAITGWMVSPASAPKAFAGSQHSPLGCLSPDRAGTSRGRFLLRATAHPSSCAPVLCCCC